MPSEKMIWPHEYAKLKGIKDRSFVSALKRAAGIKRHRVFESELDDYLKSHPEFRPSLVYPRRAKPATTGTQPS